MTLHKDFPGNINVPSAQAAFGAGGTVDRPNSLYDVGPSISLTSDRAGWWMVDAILEAFMLDWNTWTTWWAIISLSAADDNGRYQYTSDAVHVNNLPSNGAFATYAWVARPMAAYRFNGARGAVTAKLQFQAGGASWRLNLDPGHCLIRGIWIPD